MVFSCWHGTLLWKQQWWSLCGGEHSPPGTKHGIELTQAFSYPIRLSNKILPPLSFCSTPPHLGLVTSVSAYISCSVQFYPMPPVCFSSSLSSQFHPFFCSTKTDIHQWHRMANNFVLWECRGCTEMPSVGISASRFAPALPLTLCLSFTEGSLFSIAPVWEQERHSIGGELLAVCPAGKNREWRSSAKKSLTGHLYHCWELQQLHRHARSYLLKIHGPAWYI